MSEHSMPSIEPSRRPRPTRRGAASFAVLASVTAALFCAAIFLRALEAPARVAPEQRDERPVLASPHQFLGPSAMRRAEELAVLLPEELRGPWRRAMASLNSQLKCPRTIDWLATPRGQEFERTLAELARGDSAQGLAGLVMLVELARNTQWQPSMFRGSENAERLGDLLQTWLSRFAEKSTDDVTLHEPALSAALLYARVMRAAYDAPTFGRNEAPYERARAFTRSLCGTMAKDQTAYGRELKARHPRAFLGLLDDDFLAGADEEARLAFPDIDGNCGR